MAFTVVRSHSMSSSRSNFFLCDQMCIKYLCAMYTFRPKMSSNLFFRLHIRSYLIHTSKAIFYTFYTGRIWSHSSVINATHQCCHFWPKNHQKSYLSVSQLCYLMTPSSHWCYVYPGAIFLSKVIKFLVRYIYFLIFQKLLNLMGIGCNSNQITSNHHKWL